MHATSELYNSIISGQYIVDVKVRIDNVDYGANTIVSLQTSQQMFSSNPSVGAAICAEIDLCMIRPSVSFSRMAKIEVFARVTDGSRYSEWIPKGVFFIDTRKESAGNGVRTLTIHGYDAMLKTVVPARSGTDPSWNALKDYQAVQRICEKTGISLDPRVDLSKGLSVPDPGNDSTAYTCRECLAMIGAWYGGNWVMSDEGKLLLVRLNSLPGDDQVLVNELGYSVVIGGNEIHAG